MFPSTFLKKAWFWSLIDMWYVLQNKNLVLKRNLQGNNYSATVSGWSPSFDGERIGHPKLKMLILISGFSYSFDINSNTLTPQQRSKLNFSKNRLLATVNCKMVAINKNSVAKKKKNVKGRTLHDILHVSKKTWREDTSWPITRGVTVPNGTFSTLYFATVNLRIHVEFLNDERRKERDRWCRRLNYWLNLSFYW